MPPQRRPVLDPQGLLIESSPIQLLYPQAQPEHFAKVIKEHVVRAYQNESQESQEQWRLLPEIPSSAEILGSNDFLNESSAFPEVGMSPLPVNPTKKPWKSIGGYVRTHYELLRADGTIPLKSAIVEFRAFPNNSDSRSACIYTNVFVTGYTFSQIGPAAKLCFSTERSGKRIQWSQTKRLQPGTIVALTPAKDMFKTTCKIAVVAARPVSCVDKDPSEIDIFWANPGDAEIDATVEYVMVESRTGYFEAYRHILVALQKLMMERFPLSDYLVGLKKYIDPPGFVNSQPYMNLTSLNQTARAFLGEKDAPPVMKDDPLQNVNVLNQWPRVKKSSLDASQMQALQNLLTKKVAIVQGPPGTGKTFVSVSALRIMLQNWNLGDPPIIISAQTNHALDQLLMLIEPFETNFIRLGGRTSEENGSIRARTIFEVRMRAPPGACPKDFARISARKDLSALENTLKSILVKANGQNAQELETFRGLELITMDQYESLHDNEWVSEEESGDLANRVRIWLGREYRSSPPSCPPKVHFDEEEEPIEYEALGEDDLEAEKLKEDDDADILNGNFFGIRREYVGFSSVASSEKRIVKLLSSNANLWDIDPKYRGHIYNFLKREAAKAITKEFTGVFKDYMAKTLEIRQCRWKSDATMIKRIGVKLIGCTTTGLSKYRALLASLEPRILLIEEAAETLEGNVLAGMFETLEQLILVGDHKQLQANCNVEQFAKPPYNLAVSLFERLIENGLKYVMLKKQRRMISELRWLLNLEYPELGDHDSVLDRVVNRPSVPGMGGCDSYFMHHDWPESNSDTTSRSNSVEAEMIARFFNYLVLNKVDASKITVLTFYNGQRKLISRYLKDLPNLASNSFKVYTIDSYQGEENDVILLSLVRSNAAGNIGFLEKKNRSVVALSRARRGLYIFGNAHTLIHKNTESTEIWKDAIIKLRKAGNFNFDSGLPIICSNHGTKTICMDPDDLASSSGGCSAPCGGQLPCGHRCTYTCHPFEHDMIVCKEDCELVLSCPKGHKCSMRCGDVCSCPCDKFRPRLELEVEPLNIASSSRTSPTISPTHSIADWNNYNAADEDWEREIERAASIRNSPERPTQQVIIERFMEVTIGPNGERILAKPKITRQVIRRSPPLDKYPTATNHRVIAVENSLQSVSPSHQGYQSPSGFPGNQNSSSVPDISGEHQDTIGDIATSFEKLVSTQDVLPLPLSDTEESFAIQGPAPGTRGLPGDLLSGAAIPVLTPLPLTGSSIDTVDPFSPPLGVTGKAITPLAPLLIYTSPNITEPPVKYTVAATPPLASVLIDKSLNSTEPPVRLTNEIINLAVQNLHRADNTLNTRCLLDVDVGGITGTSPTPQVPRGDVSPNNIVPAHLSDIAVDAVTDSSHDGQVSGAATLVLLASADIISVDDDLICFD